MNDETKNKTAAENMVPVASATAPGAASAEEAAEGAASAGTLKDPGKRKKQASAAAERSKSAANAEEAVSALAATGRAACRRHGLKCVWVTEDGQCFDQESNARAHAKNLKNNKLLKVEV